MIEGLGNEKNLSGPQRIDLLFDRSCNLACRTCFPESSTFWEKHLRDNNLPVVKFKPTDNLATIKKVLTNLDLSNLKQVQFCGGETLLGNTYWETAQILADLVPDAKDNLLLGFQTNATQTQAVSGTINAAQSGTWNLTNITGTISLPTGAATAANQATEITSLQSLDNPVGPVSPGTAGTNSFLIGGQFNSTVPSLATTQQAAIQLDARGAQQVTLLDGCRATYSATSAIAFASAASPTDIFTITGSNSKTVRILRIGFSATQTTAGTANVLLIKRLSANAGGTSAAATSAPHDSTDSAATATVLNYTANPTSLGTSVGTVRAVRAFIPTTGTAAASQYYEFDVGDRAEKAIILRGNTQVLSVNLNSTTVSGGLWTIWVEWTEE
jgi:hypothetical protein